MRVPGCEDFMPGEPAVRPAGTLYPWGSEEHWGKTDAQIPQCTWQSSLCVSDHLLRKAEKCFVPVTDTRPHCRQVVF